MVKKLLSLVCIMMGLQGILWAQGDLKGVVKDSKGEPVPFAAVIVLKDGVQVTGTQTDIDGKYFISGLQTGKYTIKFQSVGYTTVSNPGVVIQTDKITFLDATMNEQVTGLDEVVVEYTRPLIDKDDTKQVSFMDKDQIMKLPTRNLYAAATTFPGVFSRDGELGNVRGSRSGVTVFIDGVKIRGLNSAAGIPYNAAEEVQLILGGVPAKYGDATGGIFEITTRQISNVLFGGIEGRTSKFLDNWGHYYFNAQLGGPMIRRKGGGKPIAGFLATVEGGYDEDPNPTRGGSYRVKQDVLDRLMTDPLRLAPAGQTGTRLNSEFLRTSDFQQISQRQNVASMYLNVVGKFDFSLTKNTFLSAGGFVNLRSGRIGDYNNIMFNWENNGLQEEFNWNVWGRVTQFFASSDTSKGKKSVFQNAKISLQVDYLKGFVKSQDANHGSNFFNYGYVGRFTTYRRPTYAYGYDPKEDKSGFLFTGNQDTLVTFTPSDVNPLSSAITSQYYTFFNTNEDNYDNFANLQNRGAIINGQAPRDVYGMWNNVGEQYNNYSISNTSQFRVVFNGSATIKDHKLEIGFEFEQRNDRAYTLGPVALWTLARQYTNFHLGTIDTSQPQAVFNSNGVYQDTINYPALYEADPNRPGFGLGQTFFDWNLRQLLGYSANSLNFIDVDDLDPSTFTLDMFSTDELLNQGNNLVSYYGYDAYGNLSDGGSFEDFFLATDQYGNKTRPVSPFQPIYMAGYVMDKFSFKDIVFNVGLRVDYYDANQKMLVDKYSLYQTRTAGDLNPGEFANQDNATNVQDDWVVYVNDKNGPTEILGYRDGDTWYNSSGQVINDPSVLRTASGRVQPLLVDPTSDVLTNPNSGLFNAFTDYKPQVNVMPRIAFSFPVTDKTSFVAYYDVLTQRPSNAVRLNPLDYFFWDNSAYNSNGVYFNNPNLRPERTTDFSLGFRQELSESSSLKINAFYREMRDYIALVRVNEAYPRTYGSWENIDFGTVKGLSLEYILRKNNFYLSASYTLQFADNTGSSNTSALNLVNSGQPNLRTTIPTNYDRRHLFTGFFTFDFGDPRNEGDYIGPRSKKSGVLEAIFKNLGFSMTLRGGSGVPYSRQSNFIPTQTTGGQASLLGSINGARLPWEFNIDLQVYKNINFLLGKKDGEGDKKPKKASLQIYLQVTNLFDIANTISVYSATASATDDGYLTAPQFQPFIDAQVDPQSFRDMYTLKMNDPRNFSLPRRIRLGAVFSF